MSLFVTKNLSANDLLHTPEDIEILRKFNYRSVPAWGHDYADAAIMRGKIRERKRIDDRRKIARGE